MYRNIMFQGTGSTVGKSLITAALCRIFKQDNINVAPFKSQNMSLNSFITKDGKEMGRAQAVQAEACKIEPMVEMNPILLKPTSDVGSQVILNGEVYKNVSANLYHKNKAQFKKHILEAYDKLDKKFDVIVLEGAGSPSEINLRENDLVNMGMAEMVDSPVVLIGDIDKGGVFASIYGTYMLLEPNERERIKGYIINKFRGDVSLLQPGIDMFKEKIDIPCLGVIPYMDINIDDEDSVTTRFDNKTKSDLIIGVIRLPYMSNFTDFTALELERDVSVRYITKKEEFSDVDLIIIPGSKNTLKDMLYISEVGFHTEIYKKHKENTPIIGICGGYQILGNEILDLDNVESTLNRINGLSLLDIKTTIKNSKKTVQIEGNLLSNIGLLEGINKDIISGYEIHMGETEVLDNSKPLINLADGRLDGAINDKGNVIGTYLHGIFDNDNLRNHILNKLRKKKGLNECNEILSYKDEREKEYDKLADIVRNSLDINKINKIIDCHYE